MNRTFLPSLCLLAVILVSAAPASALVYDFNFLFEGTANWSTVDSAGVKDAVKYELSNISVNFSFDTDDSMGQVPTSRVDSYVINSSMVNLLVQGKSWTSYIPFKVDTEFFIEMNGDQLQTVSIGHQDHEGSAFAGSHDELNLLLFGGREPGTYRVEQLGVYTARWDKGQTVNQEDTFITGTLTPAPTPIPGAAWLFGSGLVGLVGLRRKMKK